MTQGDQTEYFWGLAGFRHVDFTAAEDESAVAILTFNHVFGAHFVPHNRMSKRAAAAIAGDFAAINKNDFWRFE